MKKTKQIERIEEMERLFDDSIESLKEFEKSLKKFKKVQKNIEVLESYYTSKDWRKDFEDDEKGKFNNLKRGVLSEDGIYNLLEDYKTVQGKLEKVGKK